MLKLTMTVLATGLASIALATAPAHKVTKEVIKNVRERCAKVALASAESAAAPAV